MLTDASAAARQAAAYMTIFWQKRSSRGAENRHRQTLAAAMHVSTACAQAHMCHVPNGRVVKEVASVRTSLQNLVFHVLPFPVGGESEVFAFHLGA